MKSNHPPPSNYVRIVYLKEMRPEVKLEEEEQTKTIRNSLAYLSSLIQEDNKKRLAQSMRVSIDWGKGQIEKQQSNILQTRKRSKDKTTSAVFDHQHKSKQRSAEPRKLLLNKIWNQNGREKMRSIDIQKPKSKSIKLQLEALPARQRELQQSFIDFCNHLKHQNGQSHNKILFKQKQEYDKIIYTKSREYQTPQKNSFEKKKEKNQEKIREIHSETKNNKIFSANRKSIVYRKNFKEINNFDWGKIAEGSYDISNLKYS